MAKSLWMRFWEDRRTQPPESQPSDSMGSPDGPTSLGGTTHTLNRRRASLLDCR